jgi:hypothetical protein
MRRRISSAIDQVSHMTPEAHDSDAVIELQHWHDELELFDELPELDPDNPLDLPEIDLERLRGIPTELETTHLHV